MNVGAQRYFMYSFPQNVDFRVVFGMVRVGGPFSRRDERSKGLLSGSENGLIFATITHLVNSECLEGCRACARRAYSCR